MEILDINRLTNAKRAFSTRRVDLNACKSLSGRDYTPKSGDLVLARVTEIGSHKRIELPCGRKALLHPGDEILLAFGNRYAPDQYEAYVPKDLQPCHMVAAGGVAAEAVSWHERLFGPTSIEPIGVVCGANGRAVNLCQFALPTISCSVPAASFAVLGSSMNAGKTITAASLVKGFTEAGFKAGALKITGTAAGGDPWLMRDFGAAEVYDFTDAGFATTFQESVADVVSASQNLLRALGRAGCDIAVVEVADGLYQKETAELVAHPVIRSMFDGVFFAANDALGATTGARRLKALGHNVLGVSGAVMRSPLAAKESASQSSATMLHLSDLKDPIRAQNLVNYVFANRAIAAE